MKIDTLFKPQTRKITPYSMEKQKLRIARTGQLYFVSVTHWKLAKLTDSLNLIDHLFSIWAFTLFNFS